ncbi:MAG: NuoM family protein, partial [Planctomycetaceae bacterium]
MSFANFLPVVMVLVPLGGAVAVLASARLGLQAVRSMALVNTLLTLALAVLLVRNYQVPPTLPQPATPEAIAQTADQALQMRVAFPWTSGLPWEAAQDSDLNAAPPVEFALGVDGISLWLIVLSALLLVPAVLVSWNAITDRPAVFYALMLVLQAGMIGVFAAQDILLFYVFFEFTLIPLFFMIGIWGGADRRWAARKFFIFTLAGSVLTFLGLLFIVLAHKWLVPTAPLTFSIPTLTAGLQQAVGRSADAARFWQMASPWVFLALFAGFAIKVPLFPFHSWLPLAHVEAPTAGSVLLAGVLLKIGSYGFLRFALPLVPAGALWAFHAVALLAVIGIIYGALLALAQEDIKKLVAYSSVSHMGFCLLGLFAFNTVGLTGGLLQMLNHGLSTGALFALVGMLYERYHTRDIAS